MKFVIRGSLGIEVQDTNYGDDPTETTIQTDAFTDVHFDATEGVRIHIPQGVIELQSQRVENEWKVWICLDDKKIWREP